MAIKVSKNQILLLVGALGAALTAYATSGSVSDAVNAFVKGVLALFGFGS